MIYCDLFRGDCDFSESGHRQPIERSETNHLTNHNDSDLGDSRCFRPQSADEDARDRDDEENETSSSSSGEAYDREEQSEDPDDPHDHATDLEHQR